MPTAGLSEKRKHERESYKERGFFYKEGREAELLRLCDVSVSGVGAFSRNFFQPGERGVLSAKLPHDDIAGSYQVEVRWCEKAGEGYGMYPFRVGLKKINGAREDQTASREKKESDLRVKGRLFIDLVKLVRKNKDQPWHRYLTPEDMAIVNDMIIPSAWYPLGTFRRVGKAAVELIGGSDPQKAEQWGMESVDKIPTDLYKSFFEKNDPKAAVKNYVNINQKCFDFMRLRFHDAGENRVKISLEGSADSKRALPELDLVILMQGGAAEKIAQKNGASSPRISIEEEGEPGELISVLISWS